MINLLLFFLVLLPVLCEAAYQGTSISTPPPVDSGMVSGASTNATALQNTINGLVTRAANIDNTLNMPVIQMAQGLYGFTTGITSRPWVKLAANGNVELDFSGAGSAVDAVRVYNDDAPSGVGTFKNAANQGPFLNGLAGAIFINGPGASTSSVGLDVGDSTSHAGQDQDFRDTSVAKVRVMNFGTCIKIRRYDTYLLNFDMGGAAEQCGTALSTDTGYNSNSGERMSFKNWTFASSTYGFVDNQDAFDVLFDNDSFDFLTSDALQFNGVAGYQKVAVTNSHFENVSGYLVNSSISEPVLQPTSQNFLNVIFLDDKWVSTSNSGNAPNRELFYGVMNLDVHNLYVGGFQNYSNAAAGMFMVDPNVNVTRFDGVTFNGFEQLTAKQLLVNSDPFFAQGTVGADLQAAPMPSWTASSANNIAAVVDTTHVWTTYGGTQSIKFTCTGGSNYYVLRSDRFPVKAGDHLLADLAYYGGTSTGTVTMQMRYLFYSNDASIPFVPDATGYGDNMSTVYGETGDPAYTGGRAWWAKPNNKRDAYVPTGYDWAQLEVQISAMNNGDVVWLGFAGVNKI